MQDLSAALPIFPFTLLQVEAEGRLAYAFGAAPDEEVPPQGPPRGRRQAPPRLAPAGAQGAVLVDPKPAHLGDLATLCQARGLVPEGVLLTAPLESEVRAFVDLRLTVSVGPANTWAGARPLPDGIGQRLAGIPVRALSTPGVRPGAACFLAGVPGGRQALFTGPTLGIGEAGEPGDAAQRADLQRSLARLGELVGDVHVLPGWRRGTRSHRPLGAEKVDNPALAASPRSAHADGPKRHGA